MKEETYRRPTAGDHPPNLSPDYKSTTGRAPTKPAIALPHSLSEITGPLLAHDPIYNSVPAGARQRLQASFEMDLTQPEWALGYRFDIVLRGRNATPME